jgi:tetratricopeptide (TPR) repeat protein
MLQLDILGLIPQSLKRQALDTLVDFVSEQARKYASEEIAARIKKLRSDAAFNQAFEEGLKRAIQRFVQEYEIQDEDLVAAIAADADFFNNEEVRAALLTILKNPGVYLASERERLAESFDSVLPGRKNRERVDRAVIYLLKCLAEEVWHLPELQPIYSLQFQRMTAEATRQQVELQKAQLQALTSLNAGVREALLQLTDAIAERKLLPAGEGPALPAPPFKPKVYHNLPQPDYGRFVGREQELAQVARILRPYPHSQHALVTIDGIGGIGKSALALEVAHRYLRNYERIPPEERFEAIIWTSAKQSVLTAEGIVPRSQALRTLDDIYATIAVALQREDITRAQRKEQAEVVRNALTRQRTLLIVDNLETVDDEAVLTFLRELPAPTKAIVTTRHRIDVAYPVRLVGMPSEDARRLIAQECDKKGITLGENEVNRLYDRTGGVPLAVVWSVAQMGFGYSANAVLSRLGEPTGDITKFCFEASVASIREKPPHKALMALSLFAASASREAIGSIVGFGQDVTTRDEALVILEKLSLIDKESDRFHMLPLTRAFASDELRESTDDREFLTRRWIDYFVDFAEKRRKVTRENLAQLEADYENINHVVNWLAALKDQSIIPLIKAMEPFLLVKGYWSDWGVWLEQGKEVVILQNNELLLGYTLYGLGRLHELRREPREARQNLEGAYRIFERYERIPDLVNVGTHLSRAYMFENEYDRAAEILEECRQLAHALDLPELLAGVYIRKGEMFTELGRPDEAERNLTEALGIYGEREPSISFNFVYWCLGKALIEKGDYEKAHQYLLQALDIADQMQFASGTGQAKRWLASLKERTGDLEEARRLAVEAKDIFSHLGMRFHVNEMEALIERVSHRLRENIGLEVE